MFEFELAKKEEEIKPDFGPVGSIVDTRTYRRWLPNKKRRETFVERNTRVVDANLDLVRDIIIDEEYNLERSIMLDHMNKLLALPSGRSMWIAGTEANKKHPASSFNCSALAINRIEAFTTVFELLMLGTGVGFRVFSSDINKLPSIKKFDIEFEDYNAKPKQDRLEDTTAKIINGDTVYVEVGDSRKGWIDSLDTLLRVAFNTYSSFELHDTLTLNFDIKKIVFNFNSVRPLGERINGFGGTASGHEALKTLLQDVYDIFNECPTDKLRSIDCLDICCAIAKGVVAGNTRRSALLCLFEEGDDLMAGAKVNLFDDPSLKNKYYRIQSNNTEALGTKHLVELREFLEANPDATKEELWHFIDKYKPSVEWLKERFKVVANAGDPGFANYLKMIAIKWLAVRRYRPDFEIKNIWQYFCDLCSNPCFEIILSVGYKNGEGVGFCLSEDTLVLTKEGNFPIKDLVNKEVEIWDGNEWVNNNLFRQTQSNAELYQVTLKDGSFIKATLNHRFVLEDGTVKSLANLVIGDSLKEHNNTYSGTFNVDGAYAKGFLLGDGSSETNRKGGSIVRLKLYNPKLICFDKLKASIEEINISKNTFTEEVSLTKTNHVRGISCRESLIPWGGIYKKALPVEVYNWSYESKLEFLTGLFDADGTAINSKSGFSYQLSSINKQLLLDIQQLLKTLGIKSRVNIMVKRSIQKWSSGYLSNASDLYSLKIHQANSIKFAAICKFIRLKDFSSKVIKQNKNLKYNEVISINKLDGLHDVYCTTVESTESFALSNGIMSMNCNLTTLPINKFVIKRCNNNDKCAVIGYKLDEVALEQAVRLTVRIALRQTFVTMPRAELDDTQKAERLLGVSVTGWVQLFAKLDLSYAEQEQLMKQINGWANNEADVYSAKLQVERPLLVCCIKPEGTGAKVLGSSSGVHWDWAPYYINRIQMGANDALAITLKQQGFSWIPTPYDLSKIYPTTDIWKAIELFRQMPQNERELLFNSSNAVLFEFPINSGMVESQGSVSASRQLQNVLRFSDNYVDHMVSSTITAKEDEWDNLAEELHGEKNWSRFTNAAFLSYYSGNHPLLPNEEITEDVYNNMMSSFKDSEWVKDGKFYVNEDLLAELEQAALGSGVDIDDVDLGKACEGSCPVR